MESKPQQIVQAKRKAEEILGLIHYDTTSLTHAFVKAFRAGMPPENGRSAYGLLREALVLSEAAFEAAIAQPENKIATRPVVNL